MSLRQAGLHRSYPALFDLPANRISWLRMSHGNGAARAEDTMQINRTMLVLGAIILLLVASVAFLLGQRSSSDEEPAPAIDASSIISSSEIDDAETPEPISVAEQRALAVRIGRDGPNESACDRVGRVANLPGGEDDFLSVRNAPTSDAGQIDQLEDDTPFYVCDRQGDWFGIVYLSDGTLGDPDECGLAEPVGSPRAYPGTCLTGWVHSRYVDASGAQDSDEPYVEDDAGDAPQARTVQVSATGPSQVVASMRMSVKAENEYDKPVGQRPDGNRVACRETGTGDAAWTCTATYTLTN